MNINEQFLPIYINSIKRFEVHVLNCKLSVIDSDLGYQLTKTEVVENYELSCLLLRNIPAAREYLCNG